MLPRPVAIGLATILLTACAPVPPQAPPPPAPPPEAAAAEPAEPPEPPRLAKTDVRKMTCATLTATSDDDKAYASTFLLGYRSALSHTHTIEVKQIEAVEEAALADCASKPDAMASKVFAVALAKIRASTEPAPKRAHRKPPPAQATAGQPPPPAAPAPAEPAPAAPASSPPMQYTPAQTTPPQFAAPAEPPPAEAPPSEGARE